MTARPTARLTAYTALAAIGLIGGLAAQRVEPVVFASPFVVVLLVGLATHARPRLDMAVTIASTQVLEGDEVVAHVDLQSDTTIDRLELVVASPGGLRTAGDTDVLALRLVAGEPRAVEVRFVADRWGVYELGRAAARCIDLAGLYTWERVTDATTALRVYPRPEVLSRLGRPVTTQLFAGDRTARHRAEGIEHADTRPFATGDRLRAVNWRVTARRGGLWVDDHHPERSTDIVIFLDTFTDAAIEPAVRAASTLASAYLRRRDRVALVGFGGLLRWLRPGSGLRQLYQIFDVLLETRIMLSFAWKDVTVIPPRVLPPGALVVAISALEDDRAVGALVDLRARGFEVAVVEIEAPADAVGGAAELDDVGRRLWLLQRELQRDRYRQLGIAVAEWHEGEHLELAMEEVWSSWRGHRVARR